MQHIEDTPCVAGTLRRASRSVSRLYDVHLARAGLTTTQLSILRTVQRHGGRMALAQMAADLVFERTSLYRALTPLRRAGLITIRTGTDRRTKDVALTAKAHRCIAAAMLHWAAAQRVVLDRFGRTAWAAVASGLTQLAAITQSAQQA
ncbi:MAG TPA: MarR family winged helix-turn-helix transcriptional regulator [Vicinamibacterales bacterium]|nr:MarR family winged helix-turn-helix transcriptional regulator [Vicinamibacterales bacterium]